MTITYKKQELLVDTMEQDNTILYRITWPGHSLKIIALEPDSNGNPVWHYIDQDPTKQAAEIGDLIEQLTS